LVIETIFNEILNIMDLYSLGIGLDDEKWAIHTVMELDLKFCWSNG